MAGACVGDGDFHHDDTVFVTHDAVGCESRQVFKKVLRGGAVGVFQGKILVKPGAQKTDGYQISQGLLLDETSQFLAKPELEIYADDVACSHGSTSGAVDEDALFYLTSRGIAAAARREELLVLAFLDEAIAEIEDAGLADELRDAARRLARAPADAEAMRGAASSTRSGDGWRDPRGAMAAELARRPERGAGARACPVLACGLLFVASLPNALREARGLDIDDPVAGGGRGASLRLCRAGAAPRLRPRRGRRTSWRAPSAATGSFAAARAALFWSVLLAAPLALVLALVGVAAEARPGLLPWVAWLGYAGLAFWLWLFAASLAEAEGFAATGTVAAVVAAAFAGIAGLLALVASRGGA